jgi:hypothetical protein
VGGFSTTDAPPPPPPPPPPCAAVSCKSIGGEHDGARVAAARAGVGAMESMYHMHHTRWACTRRFIGGEVWVFLRAWRCCRPGGCGGGTR